jgi:hypothetical protein
MLGFSVFDGLNFDGAWEKPSDYKRPPRVGSIVEVIGDAGESRQGGAADTATSQFQNLLRAPI